MSIKKKYKQLVNSYSLFTRFQVWRFRKDYPAKILNDNYNTSMPTVHFLHRYLTVNTGDKVCGYYKYFLSEFKDYKCIVHDVNSVDFKLIKKTDIVIVGGGGLLNATAEWNFCINKAAKLAGKAVIWSAGFNSDVGEKKHSINFNLFDLVAVRDFLYKDFRYVPCATCVMPELDKEYSVKRKIGVVAHKDVPSHLPKEMQQYDRVTNSASLQEMVGFIGSCEIVLTNSYHAVYWCILMKKKCILFAPRSEKYDYYKYPPALYSGNLQADISRALIYPEAFKESVTLTIAYLEDIKLLIKEIEGKNN